MEENSQLKELERRLVYLEKEANELKIMLMGLKSESTTNVQNEKPESSTKRKWKKTVPIIKEAEKTSLDLEKQIGQVWLPRIFIFVLLVGVIWAFKAASTYGFINEPLKVIIGYIAAAVLIYLGYKQIQKNRIALGQVLLGGSIVLLLIDTFAAHMLYGMIPTILAFVLNIVWVLIGIYFANRYKSQPLAILTTIGGYLIPFLIESVNPNVMNFVVFETIFYLALLMFAMRKQFVILYYVAFGMLHLTMLAGTFLFGYGDVKIFAIAIGIQHVCILVTFLIKQEFMNHQMGILFTSFLLAMAWLEGSFPQNQFEIIILGSFAVYTALSVFLWNKGKNRLSVSLSIATFALMIFFVNKFEIDNISSLLMIQGLISIYLGFLVTSKLKQVMGIIIFLVGAVATVVNPFQVILSIEFVNFVVLITSMFVLIYLLSRFYIKNVDEMTRLKTNIHAITMVLILYFISLTSNAITINQTENIQYMAVSFTWAIYSLICLIFGAKWDYKMVRIFGLILLFLTLAKLIFVDLSYLSLSIRAFLFILLGLIGIIVSRIYYKNKMGS